MQFSRNNLPQSFDQNGADRDEPGRDAADQVDGAGNAIETSHQVVARPQTLADFNQTVLEQAPWQAAFRLSPNVRFTRTPESVVTRKSPVFDQKPLAAGKSRLAEGAAAPAEAPAEQVDVIPAEVFLNAAVHETNSGPVEQIAGLQQLAASMRFGMMALSESKPENETKPNSQTKHASMSDEPKRQPQVAEAPSHVLPTHAVPAPALPAGPLKDIAISDFAFWDAMPFGLDDPNVADLPVAEATPMEAALPIVERLVAKPGAPITDLYREVASRARVGPRPLLVTPTERPKPAEPVKSPERPKPVAAPVEASKPMGSKPVVSKPAVEQPAAASVPAAEPTVSAPVVPASSVPAVSVVRQPQATPARPHTVRPAEAEYEFPPISLLQKPQGERGQAMQPDALQQSAGLLESVLEDFGVKGEIIDVCPGPVVTLYEFEPAPGVKSSRVIGLSEDIARSMSALSARVAVVPGRNVIGIELPNETRETVWFRELIECEDYWETKHRLALCLGKTIGGEPVIAELAKMPHLLVAGTTGSGKSVAINTMILSLLYRLRPEECRLIMIDPKMLELSIYDGIPHLLTPVVTDPKKAVLALKWAVREMEDRYRKMSRLGVRNIDGYNQRSALAREKGEVITVSVQSGFDRSTGEITYEDQELDLSPMPYIVVIVDEMADLMMVAGKDIEGAIQRLAQMARAAGIHLIMATQRPSVDVITGTIKANFPTRISFQVTSKIDSRTILGEQGAENLLGQGDMLHMAGGGRISRVHGPFVSDAEVESIVRHLKTQGRPEYLGTVTEDEEEIAAQENDDSGEAVFDKGNMGSAGGGDDSDELFAKAVKIVMKDRKCSTSYIQRRLSIGYNRAASLVERMEQEGLVGPANHVGKREIISGNRPVANPEEFGD